MKNKSLTPQIRFKGYEDEWQQSAFGGVCTVYDGVHQTPHYTDSGVMFVSVENIKTLQSKKFISLEDFKSDYNIVPEKNDLLMTRIGDIGTANIVQSNEPLAYYVSLALLKSPSIDSFFFKSSIGCPDTKRELWKRTLHIAFPKKINKNEISLVGIKFPSASEQKQIGGFFKQIDEMIAEAEREVNRLEKMKQASLQKMFPRPGATAPEIRFDGYTEPWIDRKISDFASFSRGQGYTKNDLRESGTPIFLYGRLYTKYSTYVDSVDTYSFVAPYSVISKGSEVVMPSSGETAEDIAVASAILAKGIILSGGLNIIIPNNDIDQIFLALSLTFSHAHYELAKKAQGKSVVHIYNQDIADLTISCPSTLDEQKAIGEYFRNLDSLISAKRQKLVKLRNIKQACLDKMFVNTSDL